MITHTPYFRDGSADSNAESVEATPKRDTHCAQGDSRVEFKQSYCTINHRLLIVCLVAICAGIVMKLPPVWGLGLLGSLITLYHPRFARMRRNVR